MNKVTLDKPTPPSHDQLDRPFVFGEYDHLVGVATLPGHADGQTPDSDRPAIIMMTPGMLHHVGPYRMYVQLARGLSKEGFLSFRFDLSGIGESLAVGTSGTSLERATSEAAAAMDLLQSEFGIEKFILFGLCSGADDSVHTALKDDRVTGAILLDACGFATKRFYWQRACSHYLPRVFKPFTWRRSLEKFLPAEDTPASLAIGDDIREFPDRDQAAKEIQSLVDRNVKMRFVYTGGVGHYYNYENQFRDMFHDVAFNDSVSWKYFQKFDHVATLCEDRKLLLTDIVDWTKNTFGTH